MDHREGAEGWYFMHSGGTGASDVTSLAHVRKGYGVAMMTNGDNGGPIMGQIEARVADAYGWDTLDKAVPR